MEYESDSTTSSRSSSSDEDAESLKVRLTTILLYHYTNEEGANGIRDSGVIFGSTDATPIKHRRYGKGVYFTSIDPYHHPKHILLNNYDDDGNVINSRRLWAKVEWVVEVSLPEDEVEQVAGPDRDVYLFEGDLYLKDYEYDIYENPNA